MKDTKFKLADTVYTNDGVFKYIRSEGDTYTLITPDDELVFYPKNQCSDRNIVKFKTKEVLLEMMHINSISKRLPDEYFSNIHRLHMSTIRFDAGRGIGKTTAILEIATIGDLIICRDGFTSDALARKYTHLSFVSFHDLYHKRISSGWNRIFVDNASTMHPELTDLIYTIENTAKQIILVG